MNIPTPQQILEAQLEVSRLSLEYWSGHILFSYQWWLLLFLLFLPWHVWWRLVDRRRLLEISTFGVIILYLHTAIDSIGVIYTLWGYPHKLLPLPVLIETSFSLLPVTGMLLYQYYPRWKAFLSASLLASLLFAFVGEPALKWLDIYRPLRWNYLYSFFIYISVAAASKWLLQILRFRENRARSY